jgi:hypothetical protein
LEEIRDDEQAKLDNMPESLQGCENADNFTNAINALEDATGDLHNVESNIETATS